MIIKKIKIENIRSFLKQELDFPKGSLLLSGDVGAGKSTVLLAVEFALFGLGKGSLSGASLLRNGKNNGSVELNFEIDKKDITIKRTLKRSANITQDSGYIIVDNKKRELMHTELKQIILSLLNYPQELLTKTKSLIYHYTVYTPQEEMKKILLEDREIRLDLLRRIFGIDKYKKVKENSEIFLSFIRSKQKELNAQIENLRELQQQKEETGENLKEINKNLLEINSEINTINKLMDNKKIIISKIEENIKKLFESKKQFDLNENNLKYNTAQLNNSNIEIKNIEETIKQLEKEVKQEVKTNDSDIKNSEDKLQVLEKNSRDIDRLIHELKTAKSQSLDIIKRISNLNICPLCMQLVNEEYKNNIINAEYSKIKELEKNIEKQDNELLKIENEMQKLKRELEISKKQLYQSEIIKIKISNLKELNKRKENTLNLINSVNTQIASLNSKQKELQSEINKLKDVEEEYQKEKREFDDAREILKNFEIKKATLNNELKNLNKILETISKEINEKIKLKEKIDYFKELQFWLEDYFINLIEIMEKKIMLKVHNDFNILSQKWFSFLVDTELLKIRIDNEFTPLIEQAEHEIEYDFLSGGERTAIALAYRLALNQIINSLLSTIKTKGLLILDEPTEGFSSEQLDKIKFILDELNMEQIIIVSHEDKIESFVDNVIRLEKQNHVSKIII